MRPNSKEWKCVICGEYAFDNVICEKCSQTEKEKQRNIYGSITEKQFEYILFLFGKIGKHRRFVKNNGEMARVISDYDDLANISSKQAGELISSLLSVTEDNGWQPVEEEK